MYLKVCTKALQVVYISLYFILTESSRSVVYSARLEIDGSPVRASPDALYPLLSTGSPWEMTEQSLTEP